MKLALAGAALLLSWRAPACAQDATWLLNPGSNSFNQAANWTPATVPTGTAFFGASNVSSLDTNGSASIGGFTFNAGASAYTVTNGSVLVFTGAGVINNSGQTQTLANTNYLIFRNVSTAGNSVITNEHGSGGSSSYVQFQNGSTAGNATVVNNSTVNFLDFSNAGNATIVSNDRLAFGDASSAGNATITNNGVLAFYGAGTASAATITNNNVIQFFDTSSAGRAAITNNQGTTFTGNSTAGSAAVTNNQRIRFESASTAGNATITNRNLVEFVGTSSAGSATIINNDSNYYSATVRFEQASNAGNARITNNATLQFLDSSSAGNAVIDAYSSVYFYGSSTAGNAQITSYNMLADIIFRDSSTAGNATIYNQNSLGFTGSSNAGTATIVSTGNFLSFTDNSSAANAQIDSRYLLSFNGNATGGNASITNGVWVYFLGNSTGGNAAITNYSSGGSNPFVDFSGSSGPNGDGKLSVGSIAGVGEFRLGNRELTVGSNNQFTTVTGRITGAGGSLVKVGTGTLTLSGANSYTGNTTIRDGKLVVDGSLASALVTVEGGALGGSGQVGSVAVQSGGTLAPGNSIGTLTVSGSLSFAAGSTYQVEVNAAGQGDKIVVSGMATLNGGTVEVLAENGNYADATSYTILTASSVTGQFSNVTSNLAFLTPSLSYDGQSVTLTMTRNGNSFGPDGENYISATPNQDFIAIAVEQLGAGNPVYDALLSSTVAEARAGFALLAGEAHAQTAAVALGTSRMVADTLLGRLRGPLLTSPSGEVGAAFSADLPGRKDAVVLPAPRPQPRFALWGEAFGLAGRTDGSANTGALSTRGGGFLIGAEALLAETASSSFRVGAAGGYSASQLDIASRLSSGRLESGHGALYAGARFGRLRLDAGLAYSFGENTVTRRVAIRGFSDLLRSQRDSHTALAFAELGYAFVSQGLAFEPFAQLALLRISQGAATEQGGAAALRLLSDDQDLGFTTLGLRAEAQLGELPLFARGLVGWRHGFGELTPRALTSFVAGTTLARVYGTPIDRDALVAEASIDWRLGRNTTLGLAYSAALGENARDHALRGRIEVRF